MLEKGVQAEGARYVAEGRESRGEWSGMGLAGWVEARPCLGLFF